MLYYIFTSGFSPTKYHDTIDANSFESVASLVAEDFSDRAEFCIICEDGNYRHYRVSYETNWKGFTKTHILEIQKMVNVAHWKEATDYNKKVGQLKGKAK